MKRADDVICLRKQGAGRYANIYADRQVGQPIQSHWKASLEPLAKNT